jgi:tRNA-5-taurinomethyluridine 2-sulfurtransferase
MNFGANLLVGDYVATQAGPIIEIDTNVQLGQHNGLWTYTIGQGAKLPGLSRKLFVASKDHRKNVIYVALPESVVVPPLSPPLSFSRSCSHLSLPVPTFLSFACVRSHPSLFTSTITSNNFSWIWRDAPPSSAFSHEGFRASVQIRHRMMTVPVTVRQRWSDNAVQITFDEPHKAVAQGQIAVLYDGDHCLGCGTIDETTSMAVLGGSR